MITLQSSHLYLKAKLVEQVFGSVQYAYAAYNSDQKRLLITPVSSQWFVKMNENAAQFLLKNRNLKGDRTLAIREIFIDNELDTTDRELEYELVEKTNLLKIKI